MNPRPSPSSGERPGGALLVVLGSAAFVSLAATRLCDAMLPALATAFETSLVQASSAVSAYALAYGLCQLAWGPVGDRLGKLRVIALAALACSLATALAALAPDFGTLVLARALMGATAAAIFPLSLAWISDTIAPEHRQQALARFSGISVFGMVLGPLLGGGLTQAWSWRGAFAVQALLFAAIALRVWRQARARGLWRAQALQVRSGMRADFRQLWAHPWARAVLLATGVEAALGIGCLALVPTALHQRFGLPLAQAGLMVALFGLGGFVFSRSAAALLRHLPRPLLPALGSAIWALGLGLLALIPRWEWAGLACALGGFGFFTLHNTLQTQTTLLSPASTGLTFSLFTGLIFVGQSAGVSVAAWVYAQAGAGPVFGGAAVLALSLGLGLTVWLRRRERPG